MGGPDWLADLLAALMLLTAAYCTSRLVVARRWHRVIENDVELVHIAMGIVMAGMLVAALQFVPTSVSALVFGLFTLWFGYGAVQAFQRSGSGWTGSHHAVPHVVLSGAMFYMVLAQPSSVTAMTSMTQGMGSTVKFAPLGLILALLLFGYAIWYANRLTPPGAAEAFELAGVRASGSGEDMALVGALSATGQAAESRGGVAGTPDNGTSQQFLAPRLGICCHIVMCVVMGYMLIAMI